MSKEEKEEEESELEETIEEEEVDDFISFMQGRSVVTPQEEPVEELENMDLTVEGEVEESIKYNSVVEDETYNPSITPEIKTDFEKKELFARDEGVTFQNTEMENLGRNDYQTTKEYKFNIPEEKTKKKLPFER